MINAETQDKCCREPGSWTCTQLQIQSTPSVVDIAFRYDVQQVQVQPRLWSIK